MNLADKITRRIDSSLAKHAVYATVHPVRKPIQPSQQPQVVSGFETSSFPPNLPPFLMSSDQGLHLFSNQKKIKLYSGGCYGLTWASDTVYLHRRRRLTFDHKDPLRHEAIYSLSQTTEHEISLGFELFITWLHDIHSMDIYQGALYVPLTGCNSLLRYDLTNRERRIWRIGREKTLKIGPKAGKHYQHINSIFIDADGLWLMAHNNTTHTGRQSQILRIDHSALDPKRSWVEAQVCTPNAGSHAHNVFRYNGDLYWCNSSNESVMCNGEVIAHANRPCMARGLDWDGEYLIAGISGHSTDRSARQSMDAAIFVYQYSGNQTQLLAEVELPREGGLYDLRFLQKSRSLSEGTPAPQWIQEIASHSRIGALQCA